jgi:hypothetical protein
MLILGAAVLGGGGFLAYQEHRKFQVASRYVEALALCRRNQNAGLARIEELDRLHGERGRSMFPPEMSDQLADCRPLTPMEMVRDMEEMLEDLQ